MPDNYDLIDNKEANQYEFHIDGEIAKIEYKRSPGLISILHTEVPKALAGKGLAGKLTGEVLKAINGSGDRLKVYCPYVKKYIERHPYWQVLEKREPQTSNLQPKALEYSNGEVVIIWKPHLCVHSGICVQTLPAVYDPKARPWINPDGATTQAIINQVKTCPSGALTYRMEDTDDKLRS